MVSRKTTVPSNQRFVQKFLCEMVSEYSYPNERFVQMFCSRPRHGSRKIRKLLLTGSNSELDVWPLAVSWSQSRQKKVDSNRSLVQPTKWNTIGPTVHSRLEPFGPENLDSSALESANMHCELVHWRAEQPLSCNSCFLFSVKKQDDTLHTVFVHLEVRGILDTGDYSRTSSWSGFFLSIHRR